MQLRSVCIYCGSSPGARPEYIEQARSLATLLAQQGVTVVYGGARVGVMGAVADAALAAGGRVIGVIPKALMTREVGHDALTELHVVGSMHERKALMAELADGFIALPGGIGTFEELFEIWTWGQLGLHAKPCGLLNVAGYYDQLIAFLDHSTAQGFIRPHQRDMLVTDSEPAALVSRMAGYAAPRVEPVLRADET